MDGKAVAVIGDSTFVHSGITGLINAVYNGSNATVIVADNSITGSGTLHPTAGTPSTISETPLGSGSVAKSSSFTATYDAVSGTCFVTLGSYTLTTEAGASAYKQA